MRKRSRENLDGGRRRLRFQRAQVTCYSELPEEGLVPLHRETPYPAKALMRDPGKAYKPVLQSSESKARSAASPAPARLVSLRAKEPPLLSDTMHIQSVHIIMPSHRPAARQVGLPLLLWAVESGEAQWVTKLLRVLKAMYPWEVTDSLPRAHRPRWHLASAGLTALEQVAEALGRADTETCTDPQDREVRAFV